MINMMMAIKLKSTQRQYNLVYINYNVGYIIILHIIYNYCYRFNNYTHDWT